MLNDEIKHWSIIKNDLSDITNLDKDLLGEDLFQAENNGFIIDLGWYETIDKFIIMLVKKFDWENPLIRIQCDSYEQCLLSINFCLNYIKVR